MSAHGWSGYIVVAAIAHVVGWVELARRYPDTPVKLLNCGASWLYLEANFAAGSVALLVIRSMGWDFGQQGAATDWMQSVSAGIGSVTVLRAKLFTATEDTRNFVWSPATLLEGILKIADEQVRREQAAVRLEVGQAYRYRLSWEQVKKEVAPFIESAMGVDADRQMEFGKDMKALDKNPEGYPDEVRVQLFSVAAMKFAGPKVLRHAVRQAARHPVTRSSSPPRATAAASARSRGRRGHR